MYRQGSASFRLLPSSPQRPELELERVPSHVEPLDGMAFDVSAPELSAFVRLCFDYPLSGQVREKVLPALDRLGGAEGLVQKLKSHISEGIAPAGVPERELVFGKNYVEPDPPDTLLELAWEAAAEDPDHPLTAKSFIDLVHSRSPKSALETYQSWRLLCTDMSHVFFKALKDSGRVVSFKAKAASAVEAAKVTFCGKTENEDFSEDFCLV